MTFLKMNKTTYIGMLYIIAILFFFLGFALGVNSLLVPILKNAFKLSSAQSYLVLTATYSTFVLFSYPSGVLIQRCGYKRSIIISFVLFAMGLYLYIPSGIYKSFILFLLASFVSGLGNTLLQAAINPYITILGPLQTATRRMCLMTIVNRLGWAVAPIFLSFFIDVSDVQIQLVNIVPPFYIIVAVFVVLGIFSFFVSFPELGVEATANEVISQYSILKLLYRHPKLAWGIIALFFYVGIDTLCLVSIVDFAQSIGLESPEKYTSYSVAGISLGCILGVLAIPKYISQETTFKYGILLAFLVSLFLPWCKPIVAIFLIPVLTFSMSTTWGTVWALAIDGLGKYTKVGSSLLVSSIVGGAILPIFFGYCIDLSDSVQKAYWIFVPCLAFILIYAFIGEKQQKNSGDQK